MPDYEESDLEKILNLAVSGQPVAVRSYTKTSTSGKTFTVSSASRGAPGPKNGITNPGGSIRSQLSTGRQANEANAEVASAMGSRNTVTVGSSGEGRRPLSPYGALAQGQGLSSGASSSALNAESKAAAAGAAAQAQNASAQKSAAAVQASTQAAVAKAQAAAAAAQAASQKAAAPTTASSGSGTTSGTTGTGSSTTPSSSTTPYTFTPYSSSGSSSGGSSGGSKSSGLKGLGGLGGFPHGGGNGPLNRLNNKRSFPGSNKNNNNTSKDKSEPATTVGKSDSAKVKAFKVPAKTYTERITGRSQGGDLPRGREDIPKTEASQKVPKAPNAGRSMAKKIENSPVHSADSVSRDLERHRALADAARLRHAHATGEHKTPEAFHSILEAKKSEEAVKKAITKLSVSEIAELQLSLKNYGFPIKVTGELSEELIIMAKAYMKSKEG